MSVFKRPGSPFYYYEFVINKRRFCRSTKETTERAARAVERKIKEEERENLKHRPAKALSLDQCFAKYWLDVAPKLAESWQYDVRRYSDEILNHVEDRNSLIAELTDSDVNYYVKSRVAMEAGPYAINRALAVWRRVHNLSRKIWKQPVQVIDWTFFFSPEAKRTTHFNMANVVNLIEALPEHIANALEFSIYTGLRKAETYRIRWTDIDLNEAKFNVRVKGGDIRTVWLSTHAREVLSRCDHEAVYVFDRTNRRVHWEAAREKIGKPGARWHDLRHTHATWLRMADVPVEIVQRSLGHADLATTMRYAHVVDSELRDALQKLPSISTNKTNITHLSNWTIKRKIGIPND